MCSTEKTIVNALKNGAGTVYYKKVILFDRKFSLLSKNANNISLIRSKLVVFSVSMICIDD